MTRLRHAYPPMKDEVKALWLSALLSGAYAQGQGWMRREGQSYCCLGVLCDLSGDLGHWEADLRFNDGKTYSGTFPQQCILKWAGLSVNAAEELASMNDSEPPVSFEEIARWIDENL